MEFSKDEELLRRFVRLWNRRIVFMAQRDVLFVFRVCPTKLRFLS